MATTPPREPPRREPAREREVIVTGDGRGPGGLIAAVVAIIVVLIVGYFIVQAVQGTETETPQVNVPDEVQVDVNTE